MVGPGANVKTFLASSLTVGKNKLVCLSPEKFFQESLILDIKVQEPYSQHFIFIVIYEYSQ